MDQRGRPPGGHPAPRRHRREIVAAEAATARGEMPERPFVLVGQQYLADPSRSPADNPLWAYAHVPHGFTGDATEAVIGRSNGSLPAFGT